MNAQLDRVTVSPTRELPGAPSAVERLRQRLLDVLNEPPAPLQMRYEEFLEWADEDTLAEWVNGEVIMTSPASRRHQEIGGFLDRVIGIFVEQNALGVLLDAPFQMKMENGREPDLIFISNRNLHRLRNTYLDGPADLAVEIISPESIGRDRGDKFYEYARGGVPEYWLIDPQEQWAEFYHLHGGRYQPAFTGDAGIYHASTIPGFWLKVEWLWQQPLPSVEETLLEIGGESYLSQWIERLRRRGFRIERSS